MIGLVRRSLRAKLTALLLLVLAASGALVLAITVRGSALFSDEVNHRLNREVAAHLAEHARPLSEDELDEDALKELFTSVMVVNPTLEVYLLDEEGRLLAYDAPEEKILRRRVALGPARRFVATGGRDLVRGDDPRSPDGREPIVAHPLEGGGWLYVVLGGERLDSAVAALRRSTLLRWAVVLVLAGLVAAAVVGLAAIRFATRPLERLRRGMRHFRETGEPVPVPVSTEDEVGALTEDFNAMAARLAEQVRLLHDTDARRRAFVANVSHDLRTPAAVVRGSLETLLVKRGRLSDEEGDRCLAVGLREAERLTRLVDQLLELARLEAEEKPLDREDFSLAELVQDATLKFHLAAGRRSVELVAEVPEDFVPVHADIGLVERALDNLIDNAVRLTPAGGRVVVSLAADAERAAVRVRDEGPGIEPGDLSRVLERPPRRGDGRGGTGLGLAIARRIAQLHGGGLEVESRPRLGSTFTLVIARADGKGTPA